MSQEDSSTFWSNQKKTTAETDFKGTLSLHKTTISSWLISLETALDAFLIYFFFVRPRLGWPQFPVCLAFVIVCMHTAH